MQKTVSQGFRLSPQQEHVWWAERTETSSGFVVQARVDIAGLLDGQRLARALETAVERHEILRTIFPLLPGLTVPVQSIEDSSGVLWSERSLTGLPAAEREPALEWLSAELREAPFDLANGPLLRATLVTLDGESHALILSLPALAADSVSLDLLAAEVAAAYHGTAVDGEVLQYADLAEILHDWQSSPAEEPGHTFWREQDLSALVRVTLGPAGFPQGEPLRAETVRRRIERPPVAEAAARLGAPVSLVLLAGWHATLSLMTGEEEIVVGALFDGRTCLELESALGPFARYLPVRGRSAPGSTLESLGRTFSATMADVSRRQDFFSSKSVQTILAEHGAAGWPFGFDYRRPRELPAAPGSPRFSLGDEYLGIDRFGLRLSVFDDGQSLRAELAWEPALLPREETERLLERFSRVLDGLFAGLPLGEIDVLSEAERESVLLAFNRTESPLPADLCAHHLFEERARLAPDAPALVHAGLRWTYAELNARANRLAHHLRASGISPGSLVGIRLERSPELVEALLGVLKAGAAYVPLDPGYPAERLAFMAEDAGLSLLVTDDWLADHRDGIAGQSEEDPPRSAGPADLAYVIYTSGSTGRPKGVMIPHRGLVNYLLWARQAYAAGEGNGAPVHSAIGFDLTVTSLLVPLAAGTAVTLLDERRSVEALVAALRDTAGFSLVKLTPAHLDVLRRELCPEEHAGRSRALVIGGEALRGESVAPWRKHAPETRLINEYGPTEATVGCCVYEIAPGDPAAGPVPIGRPIANTRLYVLGPRLRPVPPGAPGELWIGGDGLARGYLGQPALTAERFAPDPFAAGGGRLYRTGDLVRLRPDGHLEFLGRIDSQLKIRGFRIEPGEIEAALAAHPQVREAVVVAREDEGGKRLVAYVVPRSRDAKPAASELRRHLESRLPDHMVPAAFVGLDSLPLTPNGKLDRQALPDPGLAGREKAPYAPPRTLFEEVMAGIWSEVLGVDMVGIDDHFFSLGGDSIRSIQVLALANQRGFAMTLQDLFRAPTIRKLAESSRLDGVAPEPEPDRAPFSLISLEDRERLDPGIEDAYPLSQLQAGMLFHSELARGTAIYHDLHSFHVRAVFAPDSMREAVRQVSLLHPVLRTSFDLASFSEPLQLVHAGFLVPLEIHDLRQVPPEQQEEVVSEWLREERLRAFDWKRPPLLGFHVHLRGETSFQFTLSFHHAILDGWSAASLLTDLFRRYTRLLRGEETSAGAPLDVAYRDFIALERAAAASEEARSFWSRTLDGAEPTRLPRLSRPAAAPGTEAEARVIPSRIDPALSDGAKKAAREAGVPLKSLLLAVHLRVASALGGTRDVLTGLISHGRPEREGGERVLGLFLNTLPFRAPLSGGTWRDLARETFELERKMLPFRRFPFAGMRALESGLPEMEIAYNYLHYHVYEGAADGGGSEIEILGRHGYEETNFPLVTHVSLTPFSQQVQILLAYRTPDLGVSEVERLSAYLVRALAAAVEHPESRYDEALLLSEGELAQVLASSAGATGPQPVAPIHRLFETRASQAPESTAIVCEGRPMSYAELDRAANRLAWHLRELGAGPEERVAVLLERSNDLVVALLAVLKAGGAYVPVDPAYPAERVAYLLADSGATVLVTEESLARSLPDSPVQVVRIDADRDRIGARPEGRLDGWDEPAGLAYIIYTSGSTGRPKGVQVTHANVARLFAATEERYRFGPEDVWTFFHSAAFDFSVWEIWGALIYGGRLAVVPYEVSRSPELFLDLLIRERVTVLNQTPSAFAQLARVDEERGGVPTDLRLVIFGGEALDPAALAPWLARHGDERPRLVNMYGITETTVHVTFRPLRTADAGGERRSLIGQPIPDLSLVVMDPGLQPSPLGVPGELVVGGAGLARGYRNRPELTAERFVPDPVGGRSGARLYRSGDRGRLRPDGDVEYLGRMDQQVKIRGFRIETGEIEAQLITRAGVRQAVVVVREDTPGHRRLVAYVAGDVAAEELRRSLRERLPDYMVPAAFVALPALPLTPNGKVDRKALPAPERQTSEESWVAPRTPVEEVLAGLWAEVLGLERVGAAGHFFDLGGHSLLATQVMSRLRAAFGVEMPLRDLFEAPVLAELAARVEAALRAGSGPLAPPLVTVPRQGPLPLSFAQQRLWVIDQLEPGSPLYNVPVALRVEGPLGAGVLAHCLTEIVRRHEALRTVFPAVEGSPAQEIRPAAPFDLAVVDLSGLPEGVREALARTLAGEEAGRPFNLTRGPLLRGVLLRLAGEDHLAALTLHHIVSDGWSMGILVREVTALYAAFSEDRPSPLPELPVQYADFAAWQRSWLHGDVLESEVAFWRRQLSGLPPRLELPTDRPRPAAQSFRGASRPVRLPASLVRRAQALSRREGATLFMVLLAGFQALLSRFSGQQDLAVGTPIAGRNRVEIEGLIGFFVNTLVLRGDLTGEPSFRELLGRARETALSAHRHQDVPFEKLVFELSPERSLAHAPFFQVMLVLQNSPVESLEIRDLRLRPAGEAGRTAKFDLTLNLEERGGALLGGIEHATDLFDAATVDRLMMRYERLLEAALAAPERRATELPLLGEAERHQILVDWNDTRVDWSVPPVLPALVEAEAARAPERIAVEQGSRAWTAGELEARANRLARLLVRRGVKPEDRVAVCSERSPEMVVCLLAVWKAGAAWVPLEPTYPAARLAAVLDDARPALLIAEPGTPSELLRETRVLDLAALEAETASEDSGPLGIAVTPDHLAYGIYTSGSTGRPKGVLVSHGAIANRLLWMQRLLSLGETDAVLQKTPFVFDASIWEIFLPLFSGARLVLAPPGAHREPAAMAQEVRERGVTVLQLVPSMLGPFLEEELYGSSLRHLFCGGEALPVPLCERVFERLPGVRLGNLYGPTECAIDVTWHPCRPSEVTGSVAPLGRPLDNVEARIFDRWQQPVPMGQPGELCAGGAGLARGYLGRPGLTAERFIPDPCAAVPGARLYRTGDLVRQRPDGTLHFLGRIDHQVKIRGFRIELGEIEAALALQPEVSAAVVVVRQDGPSPRLVGYVVPAEGEEPSPAALREALLARLPDPMVPAAWVVLPSLPLTATGKVDRQALPEPEPPARRSAGPEPRSPVEQTLAAVWAEVLRLDRVGLHDNFFELGGDSILSIQVCARALKLGVRITPRLLFQHQTVAALAAVANTVDAAPAEQGLVTGPAPLMPIERWFFAGDPAEPHHFNQSVLFETAVRLAPTPLEAALGRIEEHHDALRLRFRRGEAGWEQTGVLPAPRVPLTLIDLAALPEPARPRAVEAAAAQAQASLDLERGPLYRALLLDLGPREPGRFFWAIHHLAVDGVSWRILLEDLATLYDGFAHGRETGLPAKTSPFQHWAERLAGHAGSPETEAELSYWLGQPWAAAAPLPLDRPAGEDRVGLAGSVSLLLDAEETRALLQEVPRAYNTQINDALLTALARGFADWTGSPALLLDLEGHGREEIFPDLDLSRTVGWFTSLFPVLLDLREASGPGSSLKAVKEQLRRIPRGGLGYGLLRWASRHAEALAALPRPEVVFNYLGQLDQALPADTPFRPARETAGSAVSPRAARRHRLEFNGGVFGGRLGFTCAFSPGIHRRETVERLVDAVAARLRELIEHCRAPEAGGYTPADFPLAGLDPVRLDALAHGLRRQIEDLYPLSPMQQGMLFHTLYSPDRGVYLSQISGRIVGDFDPAVFAAAWAALLDRHPILRTSFRWQGLPQPLQVVRRKVEVPLERQDWSGLPEAVRRERLAAYLREDLDRGFDLGEPPLLRLLLVQEGETQHRLVWSTHLILMDGWSQATVLRELFTLYEGLRQGRTPELPAPPPYRDYIAWLLRQEPGQAESFWRSELAGLAGTTPLPGDRGPGRAPEVRQSRMRLSAETTSALQALGRRSHLTLNTLLQGAWALLLARGSGEPEVVFGATVSGRPASLPGIESMVGLFINSLPVRTAIPREARLLDWLRGLQDRQTAARQHEHVPLVDVQGWSPLPRGTPLFESLVVFENYPAEAALTDGGPGLTIDEVAASEVTSYPLVLVALPGRQLASSLYWDASRFSGPGIGRLLLQLASLCEAMALRPEATLAELDPMPAWERHQILTEWNDREAEVSGPGLLHRLFEAQALSRPDAVAVTSGRESLTYGELHRQASGLAHRLRALGVGPEAVVGLCLERTPDLVAAMLGVLAAGGAYLPLDPSHPRERLAFLLEDSGAALLLSERHLAGSLPEGGPPRLWLDEERSAPAGFPVDDGEDPESLAYVIYTSGSTGRPKGVAIAHRSAAALVRWTRSAFSDDELSGVLASTSIGFDLSVFELLATLCLGGRVLLAANALELPALSAAAEVRLVNTVPSALAELARASAVPPSVSTICLAGEPLSRALVREIRARTAAQRILNLYGPSEDTTYSTWAATEEDDREPAIGRPIPGTRAYVLDRGLSPVPLEAVGELCLAGTGLARGYLGRPDLTAERFVPAPHGEEPGARLYRTGDLARYLPDGNLEFLGRIDHQVKVRGFRIELGEIETVLRELGQVGEAVVLVRDHELQGRSLVAYVVPRNGEVTGERLRESLAGRLPQYMVPATFVILSALPLNPNGKVDRRALARIEPGAAAGRREERGISEPVGRIERAVAAVWREILGVQEVGRHDSFFDLGGHSLLLVRVQSRLAEELGREISLVDLFRYPTVSALAGFLAPQAAGETAPAPRRRPLSAETRRIAVIGMAGRFPGAPGIEAFWQNLCAGVESVAVHSEEELEAAGVSPAVRSSPHFVPAGGVLDGIDLFDAEFFGYTPRDAEMTDPQHRLFLECAWEALESAGYVPEECPGPVGVFAGVGRSDYLWNLISNPEIVRTAGSHKVAIATDKDYLTTTVSYKLDLTGPSLAIQTACSTSLVAVHVACRSLLAGECDMALAGGASIAVPQHVGYLYQEGGIRSPDGHCRAFDARAQGTVGGNGVGIVVLKRLEDALADGDPVRAVILGSAINNDGAGKVGYTAPGVNGQAAVIRAALETGGVDPRTVGYVEAHGTGTPLGDPIEVAALTQAFREAGAAEPGFCALGSVKTNVGHLDNAAGVAGLIKAALAVERGLLPPTVHFESPNPAIDFAAGPFRVNDRLREWRPDGAPRRAGVSSFGIGGTNAHAILEEPPAAEPGSAPRRPWQLLVLSARTPSALDAAAAGLRGFLAERPETGLADAAWTLQTGRRAFRHRRAVLCRDVAEAVAALAAPGGERAEEGRGVVFLFPGQGAQHPGMGSGLYRSEPVFREEIDRAAEILRPWLGLDLRGLLAGDLAADWEDTAIAQPALFAVEHALASLWESWGIRPEAMIGHSLGEYVAACRAGVLPFEDGLALMAERGRLLGSLPRGSMASLPLSEDEVTPLLTGRLSLAAVNGPSQCVVSGREEEVRRLLERLAEGGVQGRRLHTSHAFHSSMVEPVMAAFASAVGRIRLSPPRIPWISNVTGTWILAAEATDPGYWAHHLRATVRFADGLATLLHPAGDRPAPVLVEAGPGRTLSALVRRHPDRTAAHTIVTSLPHPDGERDEAETVLSALGQLWSAGAPVDWRAFHAGERRRRIPLPTYPFERRRYWIEPGRGFAAPAEAASTPERRDLADWFWVPFWKPAPPVPAGSDARGPWLVFLGDGAEDGDAGLGEALLDHLRRLGAETVVVRPGERPRSREDYDALLSGIARERGSVPPRILHLRSAGPPEPVDGFAERLARLEKEKEHGFYDLLFLLQALGDRSGSQSFELTVVTANAQKVAPGDLPCPERALMHALCRVAPHEHASLSCRVLDLGFPLLERWLGRIAADLTAPASEPLIAWRGGERWQPGLATVRLEESAPLRDEGVWLVTGGLGGVGLEIAEHLAASRARLVLLGRSGLPPEAEWDRWLDGNGAAGAELSLREVDLRRELGVRGLASRPGAQESLDAFCSARLLRFLIDSGVQVRRGARYRREDLQTALRLLPQYGRFLAFLLGTLAEDGWLRQEGDEVVFAVDAAEAPDPDVLAHEAGELHPALRPILRRVGKCAAAYGPVLSGETEALGVLYSSADEGGTAESLSHEPVYAALAAEIAVRAAERPASEGRPLRVLEVGGGRGRLTRQVAPALAGRGAEYWFTDVGRSFVIEAEHQAVGAGLDFLRFGLLDASRDPVEQGYEAGGFDLLFALNVIHATPDAEATLRHLRRLLRPGGSLCLIELTRSQRWIDMIWGLTYGWWLFSDSFRQGSPLLGVESWREVLARAGFDVAAALPDDGDGRADSDCALLLATRPAESAADSTAGRIARVRRMRALGAEVVVEAADVADAPALEAAARRAVERFGRLDGVIHAAGVPGGGLLGLRTRESLEEELAAKVLGTLALGEVCREHSPDHLVLFSSTNALSGQLGQAGYCAANAFLDAWAHLFAAETGTPTLTIDWDRWQGVGMAAAVERRHRELTGEELTGGISPAEGAQAFVRALASGRTQVVVSPGDIVARLAGERKAAANLRDVIERRPTAVSVHDRPSLSTAYAPPSDELEEEIAGIWQEVFGIQRIGIHDDFFELGGDSLVALQLVSRLSKAMGIDLKVRSLFDAPTIAALAVSVEEAMLASSSEEELDLVRNREELS